MKRTLSILLTLAVALLCLLPACSSVGADDPTTTLTTLTTTSAATETSTEPDTTTEAGTTEDTTLPETTTNAPTTTAKPVVAQVKSRPKAPAKPLSKYTELEQTFLKMKKDYDEQQAMYEADRKVYAFDMAVPEEAAPIATGGDGDIDNDYGSTNVQVSGVDEGDILKNDGKYLYYGKVNYERGGIQVYILQPLPADKMKLVSTISIEKKDYYYSTPELYVLGDRLAVVSFGEFTTIRVYDIKDRANPALLRTFKQEGHLISSRMLDGRVYLLTGQYKYLGFDLKDGVISQKDILPVTVVNGKERLLPADRIAILPEPESPSYLVASSVDLRSNAEPETTAVLGVGWSQVYMNADAIYVTQPKYETDGFGNSIWWRGLCEKTQIFRFDLYAEGKIAPGPSGEVAGTPLNQFSMDEHKGYFRIATTGWSENGDTVNLVTILDKNLKETGCITGIAPGERIQSARFMGDMGYLVTFRQTDPLFTMDLSNPRSPKILGELKIPGFSAYLHPWGDKYLIGVGRDGTEDGLNGGAKVSLFDISNPKAPKEVSSVSIPNAYAASDHKAFVAYPQKDLIGIPIYSSGTFDRRGNYNNDSKDSFTIFEVKNGKIALSFALGEKSDRNTERGTYIGDTWYVLTDRGLEAYSMKDGKEIGRLDAWETSNGYFYLE